MSERFYLEQNKKRIAEELGSNMAQAALITTVGSAAGLNMDIDLQTGLPRNYSAAKELTERFVAEARDDISRESIYKFEGSDPSYFAIVTKAVRKAEEFKRAFSDGIADRNTEGPGSIGL